MHILILTAHPSETSFNSALVQEVQAALQSERRGLN